MKSRWARVGGARPTMVTTMSDDAYAREGTPNSTKDVGLGASAAHATNDVQTTADEKDQDGC